ncbi:MAG: hypothetical protein K1000chlam2_00366 [Chlamydiae bacterium]|nr:hypothetical protein [Chlamydiota bacterium]
MFLTIAGGLYDVYTQVSNAFSNVQDMQGLALYKEQFVELSSKLNSIRERASYENCFKTCTAHVSSFSEEYCTTNCKLMDSLYQTGIETLDSAVELFNKSNVSAFRNFNMSTAAAIGAVVFTTYFLYQLYSQTGKGDEEGRLGKVAAGPNSQKPTKRDITTPTSQGHTYNLRSRTRT